MDFKGSSQFVWLELCRLRGHLDTVFSKWKWRYVSKTAWNLTSSLVDFVSRNYLCIALFYPHSFGSWLVARLIWNEMTCALIVYKHFMCIRDKLAIKIWSGTQREVFKVLTAHDKSITSHPKPQSCQNTAESQKPTLQQETGNISRGTQKLCDKGNSSLIDWRNGMIPFIPNGLTISHTCPIICL